MHLLAHNLIRRAMALAAFDTGLEPWQVSFKGALQTLHHFLPLFGLSTNVNTLCEVFVHSMAAHIVGDRPDRGTRAHMVRRSLPRSRCASRFWRRTSSSISALFTAVVVPAIRYLAIRQQ